jgi:signal transduction histidine kinase
MQIKTKLLINAGLPLALMVIIGLMLVFAQKRISEDRERAVIAGDITSMVLEMNLFVNRYFRFHEERPGIQIEIINRSLAKFLEAFETKTPEEKELIDAMRQDRRAIEVLLSRLIKAYGETASEGQREDFNVFEQRAIGQIVARTWGIVSGARQLSTVVDKRIRATQNRRNLTIMTALIILGAGVATGSFLVGKNVFKALTDLEKGTQIIAGGRFDHRIDLERRDEIGELSLAFNEMAQRLEESYAALESRNRELQDFAFVASHDLQEPLRKIQAFGERLKTRYETSLGEEGRDYLNRMSNAAKRMQDLIQALLSYSRVTTKTEPFAKVDLNQVIKEVGTDLETRIEQTGGQVRVESTLPTVEADPNQMRQLFQNLIGNGLKFHREEKPLIKIHGQSASFGGTYRIFVEDNGIGFDEKYLDRIFTPFQRLHGRDTYEGTGIGLAICRKIVERHGGSITATSMPGKGSTFIVNLPVVQTKRSGA